ncbi:MAG: hypothetical protein HWN66_11425 [Candidatus Helarchaeota archaeon]|nr:hypothetical protein [Candidatus Helarchaeota archaeon]
MSFFINSENDGKNSNNWLNLSEKLPDNTLLFFLSNDYKIYQEVRSKIRLNFVPIYSVLRNNSEFFKNSEIAQIDQSDNIISPYFCPNNPKLEPLLRSDIEFLCEFPQIAGVQLENLEMPLLSPNSGCFCPYCSSLAEEKNIDLNEISAILKDRAQNGLNLNWIRKKFPDWLKFRMNSISNLAGKLMVMIRGINPDLFLGLNINFSKTPEKLAQNYFFLALFLDSLNFSIDLRSKVKEKGLLKQIRTVTKKFVGDINLYLQIKVPNGFNLNNIKKFIKYAKKYSFDGLIFNISTPDELKKFI